MLKIQKQLILCPLPANFASCSKIVSMEFKILQKPGKKHQLYIIDNADALKQVHDLTDKERSFASGLFKADQQIATVNQYNRFIFVYLIKSKKTDWQTTESVRKAGAELQGLFNKQKLDEVTITNLSSLSEGAYTLAEGVTLANYQFLKYRTETKKITNTLTTISFAKQSITVKEVAQLEAITEGIYRARTLVNEPLNYLSAEQLAKEIARFGKDAGFKVTTLQKAQIEKEKMGGESWQSTAANVHCHGAQACQVHQQTTHCSYRQGDRLRHWRPLAQAHSRFHGSHEERHERRCGSKRRHVCNR